MEVNLLIAGCLLAAFFAGGILFDRRVLKPSCEEVSSREFDGAEERFAQVDTGGNPASGKIAKEEVSIEEQWNNLLGYSGRAEKKKRGDDQ